jgi:prepilin-type N-terminal cleavage/methylation domain-containing protein
MNTERYKNMLGFTLVELLVVIAIIGVLSSVVIASVSGARAKGFDARRLADIKQLQLALELYNESYGQYPTSLSALTAPGYISTIPKDPTSNLGYAYVALQGSAPTSSVCGSYHLGARFQDVNNFTLNTAYGGIPGGTYGTGNSDGSPCSGSAWGGNADIPTVGGDFNGHNVGGANSIYDVRA